MTSNPGRKSGRSSKKRDQILDTAQHLFSEHGARRVTVQEICREAGASKMTFYKYFDNKQALVRAIRDRLVNQGFAKFDEIKAKDIPFLEKVDLMTRWKTEFFSSVSVEFIRDLASTDRVLDEVKRRFLANLDDARQSGELRSDLSPEVIWLVVEKLGELVRDGSWESVGLEYTEYQWQVRTLLFYGMLARPGADPRA